MKNKSEIKIDFTTKHNNKLYIDYNIIGNGWDDVNDDLDLFCDILRSKLNNVEVIIVKNAEDFADIPIIKNKIYANTTTLLKTINGASFIDAYDDYCDVMYDC